MVLHASWTHGNSVLVERWRVPEAANDRGAAAGPLGDTEGTTHVDAEVSFACVRLGWATRFVVFDREGRHNPGSGDLWCHVAVPTPVVIAGNRVQADTVMVNWESSKRSSLFVAAVHVWDGNKRIFVDGKPFLGDSAGGITARSKDPNVIPNLNLLYRGNLRRRLIYFGVSVSLRIRARETVDEYLEIRSVGIDFELPG